MESPVTAMDRRVEGRVGRIAQFPLIRMLVALVAIAAVLAAVGVLLSKAGAASWWVRPLATILGVHAAYVAFVRFYERRTVAELDRWAAGREVLLGFAAGIALLSIVVAAVWLAGGYQIAGWRGWGGTGRVLAIAAAAAYVEEVLFRGVIYRHVEALTGTWLALAVSALLFGAMHLGNPGASVLASGAVALEAGVLLGAVFVLTRRLWAPIGVHMGWNFAEGGLFGIAVSGRQAEGLVSSSVSGPDWLTGGAFGIEASALAVVVCSAAATLALLLALRRSRVMAPRWRRKIAGSNPARRFGSARR